MESDQYSPDPANRVPKAAEDKLHARIVSVMAMSIAAIAAVLAFWLHRLAKKGVPIIRDPLPELLEYFDSHTSSRDQLFAHRVGLITLVVATVVMSWRVTRSAKFRLFTGQLADYSTRFQALWAPRLVLPSIAVGFGVLLTGTPAGAAVFASMLAMLVCLRLLQVPESRVETAALCALGGLGLGAVLKWGDAASAFVIITGFAPLSVWLVSRGKSSFDAVALIAVVVGVVVFGLAALIDHPGGSFPLIDFLPLDKHLAITLGYYKKVALAGDSGIPMPTGYSVLLPLALAGVERLMGDALSFMTLVRGVQLSNIVFCILGSLGLVVFYRRQSNPPALLLGLALMFTAFSTNPLAGSLYANQTGVRFLGFPLILAVLLVSERWQIGPFMRGGVLGVASGFCLVLNMETGVICCLMVVSYFALSQLLFTRKCLLLGMGGVLGVLLIPAALMALYWTAGARGGGAGYDMGFFMMKVMSTGYGSLPLKVDVMTLIALHAAVIVSRALYVRCRAPLASGDAFRAAVGLGIITWLAYYLHRSHEWSIHSFAFLYGFLVASWISPKMLQTLARFRELPAVGPSPLRLVVAMAVLMIGVAPAAHTALDFTERAYYAPIVKNDEEGARQMLSGIPVHESLRAHLEEKARFLTEFKPGMDLRYVTAHSLLIPILSGVDNGLDRQEVFTTVTTRHEFRRFMDHLLRNGTEHVLLDDPVERNDVHLNSKYEVSFCDRIRKEMQKRGYKLDRKQAHWEIWHRAEVDS